jgi:hypothetical protein
MRFARKKAIGDGNCFFHALGEMIIADWSPEKSLKMREFISSKFSFDEYLQLENCNLALMNLFEGRPQFNDIVLTSLDKSSLDALAVSPEVREEIKTCLEVDWKRYSQKLATPGVWAEEWMVGFSATVLGINILIYTSDSIWMSSRSLQEGKPVAFIFNWTNFHYDPLMMIDDAEVFHNTVHWERAEEILKLVK